MGFVPVMELASDETITFIGAANVTAVETGRLTLATDDNRPSKIASIQVKKTRQSREQQSKTDCNKA